MGSFFPVLKVLKMNLALSVSPVSHYIRSKLSWHEEGIKISSEYIQARIYRPLNLHKSKPIFHS